MWITLLVMAAAISLEPFRVGMTLVMVNRPRPLLQLLTFLAGGFAMGTTVGLVVLFVLRPALGSAHFTLPRAQVIAGTLVLVTAAVVGSGAMRAKRGDGAPARTDRITRPLATRTRQLLNDRSLWTAGVAGLGIALPSVDYLAVLAAHHRLRGPARARRSARWCCSTWWRSRWWSSRCSPTWSAPERTRQTLLALARLAARGDAASRSRHCWP